MEVLRQAVFGRRAKSGVGKAGGEISNSSFPRRREPSHEQRGTALARASRDDCVMQ